MGQCTIFEGNFIIDGLRRSSLSRLCHPGSPQEAAFRGGFTPPRDCCGSLRAALERWILGDLSKSDRVIVVTSTEKHL
jgi:hypothetical protein